VAWMTEVGGRVCAGGLGLMPAVPTGGRPACMGQAACWMQRALSHVASSMAMGAWHQGLHPRAPHLRAHAPAPAGVVILMLDSKMEPAVMRDMIKGAPDTMNSEFHLGHNMLLSVMRAAEGVDPEAIIAASFRQFQVLGVTRARVQVA
jgi:hypothetical protein